MKKYFIVIAVFITFGFFADDFYAQSPTASARMSAAGDLFKEKKWQESAAAFAEVVKQEPNNGRAWYLFGLSLHYLGKYEPAIAAFEKSAAINKNPSAIYNIACGYARLNQTDKAFAWLEKALTGGAAPLVDLETDADLENLRRDARFRQMTELAKRKKTPCMFSEQARQFDFWLGDWDVFAPNGQQVGTNAISLFAGGCGVLENWTSAVGMDGKSLNYFDAATGKWHQYWIGTDGGALSYAGVFKEGAMRFEGESSTGGKKVIQKLTFFRVDENTVRQLSESSADEGKTWTVNYDFKYVKRKSVSKEISGQ